MKYFIIDRVAPTVDGILGRMGRWYVLEEEDQGNQRNISAIPEGAYVCERVQSPSFGDTFTVLDVPGRSLIRFHPLNTEEDTEGCIGLGTDVGFLFRKDEDTGEPTRKLAVLNSRAAHKEFMNSLIRIDRFILIIRSYR